MRRKQFEKIAPAFADTKAGKMQKDYLVDAFVQDDILAIDFYKKLNGVWKVLWRTLLNDKDYCNYDYMSGDWNEKQVDNMMNESRYIEPVRHGKCYTMTDGARDVIEEYIKKIGGYISRDIESTVIQKVRHIARERSYTAEERRWERIQRKMRDVPEIPSDFKRFILNQLYKDDHLLFYTKDGAFCSRCGRDVEKNEKMRHNVVGSCPDCKKRVRFKSTGRMSQREEKKEVLLIQKKEEDVILRYFKCSLLSTCSSKEGLHYSESVRTYHRNRIENYRARYIQYVDFVGDTFWTDKMNAYHQVAYGVRSCMYAGNYEEFADLLPENFRWLIPELAGEGVCLPWKEILMNMQYNKDRNERFERMYKAGLKKLAVGYIINSYNMQIEPEQKELKKILMISKPMLRYMQDHDCGKKELEILQDAYRDNCGLNDTQIFELVETGIKLSDLKALAQKRKIMKLFHYLQRVKGYGTLKSTYEHYRDYVGMAESMQYDFTNDTVRYPKDLRQAHDKATMEFYQEETDNRKRKVMRENPNISMIYQKLVETYGWENKDFIILPPKHAGEIVEEGRILHHCVGGDTYLRKHNNGTSYILFMRNIEKPEEPYYTLEIDPKDNRIIQYYGKNDTKPDKEIVDDFLNKWKQHLKRIVGSSQKALAG